MNRDYTSVSEALRTNFGNVSVYGMIVSMSKLFKMISSIKFYCDKCQKLMEKKYPVPQFELSFEEKKCSCGTHAKNFADIDYVNAISIELQDTNSFNDIDRLTVFLFSSDTKEIRVGERVSVKGEINIIQKKRNSRYFPYLFADSIVYENKKSVDLTDLDVKAITNFSKRHGNKTIEKLVSMFDASIFGYDYVKFGLLLSAANSGCESEINSSISLMRERIHALLIGPPGLAKSRLLKSVTKLVPNSRFESGQSSSAKSLTAIVTKEDENYVLRLGPIPLAKNAVCAINEFGRTTFEDQAQFLDVMEEGMFTINKHGINATIDSPTTIITSANPLGNSSWNHDKKIDINEIPTLKPILDRIDLVFVFRSQSDEVIIRQYARLKSELEGNRIADYSNYLVKHIRHSQTFNPRISDEAKFMLNEFFTKIRLKGFGSNRVLDVLYRLAKATARLKLKKVVDGDDAEEVMKFYNVMLQQFESVVNISSNPKEVTYSSFIQIIQSSEAGISVPELCKRVCSENAQVLDYLGENWSIERNRKLRVVIDMVSNNSNVKRIGQRPIVLKWLPDHPDNSDHSDTDLTCDQMNSNAKKVNFSSDLMSDMSVMSDRNTGYEVKQEVPIANYYYNCYQCIKINSGSPVYQTNSLSNYQKHWISSRHKGPCLPGLVDIKHHGWARQGRPWEL